MREVCFDTETTGLNPYEGHRLIEVGCVELIDGKRTSSVFHQLINPERDVPEESVKIHKITTEMLTDKPKFADIVDRFVAFLQDSPLIAHNSSFDMKFINYEFDLIPRERLKNEVVDSLALAKERYPGQKNSLDMLCKRFNIDTTQRELKGHGALLDAELLAEVYVELVGGSQKKLIEDKKNTSKLDTVSIDSLLNIIKNKQVRESRNFMNSENEIKAHRDFIEKYIKNSLWNKIES
ncbi:MAG: DNA polymerase III subunit epsilon [Rickettsiales bacterium]|jgi:DNA polymerase-3 subunit epsilon|nr:DNA polymerase III subunit epsilon [Rickettsiales bacterium]